MDGWVGVLWLLGSGRKEGKLLLLQQERQEVRAPRGEGSAMMATRRWRGGGTAPCVEGERLLWTIAVRAMHAHRTRLCWCCGGRARSQQTCATFKQGNL